MLNKVLDQKELRLMMIIVPMVIVGLLLFPAKVHSASEMTLTPGQWYDVSKAGNNTTINIDKPGKYTLKGESTKCHIEISSGDVVLTLEDGLSIDPGALANVGQRVSAIKINDQGGTVKMVSKPGANIYFGGYLTAPAIWKDGYNTKLVLETENSSNPGTIEAYRAHASSSAGIGSAYEFSGRTATGNIVINSGNVIATGGWMSAGIGGGGNGNAYGIFINGGNVTAKGGDDGTGIGGGFHGNVKGITITGGTVYAEGTLGAGIGSGESSDYAKNISITGGNITAVALEGGAAIGGGISSKEVENLNISGGNIKAQSRKGTGIGGASGEHWGIARSIKISGGNIEASGAYTGIGGGPVASGTNRVEISGGYVVATAEYGVGIGGGGFSSVLDEKRVTEVVISGGTVAASGAEYDIGGSKTWTEECNITITGGSVMADKNKCQSVPVDADGRELYRTDVLIPNSNNGTYIKSIDIEEINAENPEYGTKDIYTHNSKLYFWLLSGMNITAAETEDCYYYGDVSTGQSGQFKPEDEILLFPEGADGTSLEGTGTARIFEGKAVVRITEKPRVDEGKSIVGYKLRNSDVMIADANGNLKKNVSIGKMQFTDEEGKWLSVPPGVEFIAVTKDSVKLEIGTTDDNDKSGEDTKLSSKEMKPETGANTGDNVPVTLLIVLMVIAMAGAIAIVFKKRKTT